MLNLIKKFPSLHDKDLSSIQFSPCGTMLATASADRTIRIWTLANTTSDDSPLPIPSINANNSNNAASWQPLHPAPFQGHTRGIAQIAWSPDSRYLCSASDDATLMVWSIASARCVRILRGHSNIVFCAAYSPRGTVIASGSFDETLRIWDVQGERCIRVISAHSDPVSSISFNGDGSVLASASYDGTVRLWRVENGQCLRTIVGDDNPPVSFVRFVPNGRYLVVGTLDSAIRLWDHRDSRCLREYRDKQDGLVNKRWCLIGDLLSLTSGNGKKIGGIVSGSENGQLIIWDVQSAEVIGKAQCCSSTSTSNENEPFAVMCVSVRQSSHDKCEIALFCTDGSREIQLWEFSI